MHQHHDGHDHRDLDIAEQPLDAANQSLALPARLRPAGVLIASVPTTPSVDVNPHHLHDFTERSFRRMIRGHPLCERAHLLQVQAVSPAAVLRRSEERLSDSRPHLLRYYARHPEASIKRAWATLRYGFANRYLTIAWQRYD